MAKAHTQTHEYVTYMLHTNVQRIGNNLICVCKYVFLISMHKRGRDQELSGSIFDKFTYIRGRDQEPSNKATQSSPAYVT